MIAHRLQTHVVVGENMFNYLDNHFLSVTSVGNTVHFNFFVLLTRDYTQPPDNVTYGFTDVILIPEQAAPEIAPIPAPRLRRQPVQAPAEPTQDETELLRQQVEAQKKDIETVSAAAEEAMNAAAIVLTELATAKENAKLSITGADEEVARLTGLYELSNNAVSKAQHDLKTARSDLADANNAKKQVDIEKRQLEEELYNTRQQNNKLQEQLRAQPASPVKKTKTNDVAPAAEKNKKAFDASQPSKKNKKKFKSSSDIEDDITPVKKPAPVFELPPAVEKTIAHKVYPGKSTFLKNMLLRVDAIRAKNAPISGFRHKVNLNSYFMRLTFVFP